ncbi:MAG: hypothetical protein ACQEWF_18760 [Bacillota bacterium]
MGFDYRGVADSEEEKGGVVLEGQVRDVQPPLDTFQQGIILNRHLFV